MVGEKQSRENVRRGLWGAAAAIAFVVAAEAPGLPLATRLAIGAVGLSAFVRFFVWSWRYGVRFSRATGAPPKAGKRGRGGQHGDTSN